MGKLNRRYNQKARQPSSLDATLERKKNAELARSVCLGTVELEYKSEHDTSNALVAQSKKNVQKAKMKETSKIKQSKVLTKKQKKRLECLVARKQKEKNRGDILKSLSENQITQEELCKYKSTSTIGRAHTEKRKEIKFNNGTGNDGATLELNPNKKRRKSRHNDMDSNPEVMSLPSINAESDDGDEDSLSDDDGHHIIDNTTHNVIVEGVGIDLGENSIDKKVLQVDRGETINVKQDTGDDKEGESNENEECKLKDESTVTICIPIGMGKKDTLLEDNGVRTMKEELPKEGISEFTVTEVRPIPLSKPVAISQTKFVKPIHVALQRNSDIQAARLLLPILPEEQVVMETIQDNDVVIICGSTGSGKTTQVPQFLFEAGYGSHHSRCGIIGVTEPRRVAAMSMSKRVAEEMDLPTTKVSYQIRYEGNTTDETKIKFMTDGVLLKEMESDFLLSKYSVIIIDEAHERSVYTDILIGMLTRVVPLRCKRGNVLKLIIMSATLRVEDFTENKLLFTKPPPVLKIDSRQYPVTIHFNRRTCEDYVSEAFRKVSKIHQSFKLDGGIIVFLTGQREVLSLCNKLCKTFPKRKYTPIAQYNTENQDEDNKSALPKINLDKYVPVNISDTMEQDDIEYYSSDDEAAMTGETLDLPMAADCPPLHVLPLYSLLPSNEQSKIFDEVPEGHRLCIVSTNVAETSLTIPGIKYIVDSGRVKTKFFDKITGVSTFIITWTSKASANQRAGRAGRVGPGHCYRLYSSAVFENSFDEFSKPEIQRRPVDDLVLQMKNMCIDKVINFPFPSPPEHDALNSAETLLLELGALQTTKTKQSQSLTTISSLGKSLCRIPVSPRFAKMIYLSSKRDCVHFVIAISAALTVKNIFTNNIDVSEISDVDEEEAKKKKLMITRARRRWAGDGPSAALGDLMVILRAVGAFEFANCSQKFCEENGLRYKAMVEIRKLRIQLTNALKCIVDSENIPVDLKITPPTDVQAVAIRQIVLSCIADHVARRIPAEHAKSLKLKNAYQCCSVDGPVYIHPTSSLFAKLPEYVVYHEITETSKLYMRNLFTIQEDWLPLHAAYKCYLGKPLDTPPPCYNQEKGDVQCYMSSTYGPHVWPLPPQLLPYPECAEKYRWFAKLFLDGDVCEQLKQFSAYLVTPSSVMLKSWSHLQPKTESLLCCLMEKSVVDKSTLLELWDRQPTYMLCQYLKWLPDSQHGFVTCLWPPNK